MAHIHITRDHSLGLAEARKLAIRWAQIAQSKLDMQITYDEGLTHDRVTFRRPGAHGELKVTDNKFELDARLGLLLGVFRERIEQEIVQNLDRLLAHEEPLAALEQDLAQHEARRAAKHAHHAKHEEKRPAKPAGKAGARKKS